MFKENFKEKEKLVTGLRWALDTKTDWPLTVGRTSTSASAFQSVIVRGSDSRVGDERRQLKMEFQ
jgi:hypothetical protein